MFDLHTSNCFVNRVDTDNAPVGTQGKDALWSSRCFWQTVSYIKGWNQQTIKGHQSQWRYFCRFGSHFNYGVGDLQTHHVFPQWSGSIGAWMIAILGFVFPTNFPLMEFWALVSHMWLLCQQFWIFFYRVQFYTSSRQHHPSWIHSGTCTWEALLLHLLQIECRVVLLIELIYAMWMCCFVQRN